MPEDASPISGNSSDLAAPRFEVPEFMAPKSLAEVRELARLIALADWAPDSYRDIEGNYVQQKIELAIMHGATVGLGPIAALQSIAVIDGMPTIWGDGALSIVERSGLLDDMLEEYETDPEEGLTAVCTMRRRRRPTPIQNRFSMVMAEQAHLLRKEGPWQSYPRRMLKMRARSWTIRDGFADVLRGLHIREEVDDFIETRVLWPALAATHGSLPILRPRRQPVEPGRATRDAATARREPINDAKRAEGPSAPVTEAQSCEGIAAGVANTAGGPPLTTPAPAVAATNDAGAPAPATAAAGGQAGQTEPQTTTSEAHRSESFTLVDAEGEFIEVVGAVALRSAFERAFLDNRLSLDRIVKLWEANKPAREAIERLFGADALREVAERVRAVEATREARVTQRVGSTQHSGERPVQDPAAAAQGISATAESPARPGTKSVPPDAQSADEPPEPNGAGSATHSEPVPGSSPRRRPRKRVDPNADLVLTIDRGWGDQKLFSYYRAALTAVHHREPGETSEIARFREANAELETRLRAKLPDRMAEIDFLYGHASAAPRQNPD